MPISASSGLMESLKPAAHNLKAHYVIMAALRLKHSLSLQSEMSQLSKCLNKPVSRACAAQLRLVHREHDASIVCRNT